MAKIALPRDDQVLAECRQAIRLVLTTWPNPNISAQQMKEQARTMLLTDGTAGTLAMYLVMEFIDQCRHYFTIARSERFWKTLIELFAPNEVLELYLRQVPPTTTGREWTAISIHLQYQGFTVAQIRATKKVMRNNRTRKEREHERA